MPNLSTQSLRTWLRTAPIVGNLVLWGWRQFITAKVMHGHDDCAQIPKADRAGQVIVTEEGAYQLMHNGIKIALGCYYDDLHRTVVEKLKGHHEPQEERVFYEVLKWLRRSPVMIEAGSYWGYYSLWCKAARPESEVYMIEPLQQHLDAGEANFALNGVEGHFFQAYLGATSRGPHDVNIEGTVARGIERVSIDDFIEQHGLSFVHILHADVQGAEHEVLKGSARALAGRKVAWVFLSSHGSAIHQRCTEELRNHGYAIVASHHRHESFTTDGLIVARAPGVEGPDRIDISIKTSRWPRDILNTLHYLCFGWK
jgi:FkbM family methyltransferase